MSKSITKTIELNEKSYDVIADLHEDFLVNFSIHEDDDIEPLFIGSIKWDGCSNWDFPHKNYPLHFCTRQAGNDFGILMTKLYDMALELMPQHKEWLE